VTQNGLIVAELILLGGRSWNSQLLCDMFDPDSVQNILNIHIPQVTSFDKWSWAPSPLGFCFFFFFFFFFFFSVKSAHELVSVSSSGIISSFSPEVWFMLWGLKLQAMLKYLLWKIAWNTLPSHTNIGRFVSSVDLDSWVCPFCKGPQETLSHLFFECDLPRMLWWNSPWPLITTSFAARPIVDWIAVIVNPALLLAIPRKEVWKFQIFAVLTLDFIWLSRNKLIFEGLKPDLVKASKTIDASLEFNLSAWSGFVLPSLWSAPPFSVVKGNFDVAIRGDFVVATAVVSDSTGNIIGATTQKFFFTDVGMGEATAVLLTTRLAAACGVTSFVLEADALLVVLAINNLILLFFPLGILLVFSLILT
jgi:hypothetical protein